MYSAGNHPAVILTMTFDSRYLRSTHDVWAEGGFLSCSFYSLNVSSYSMWLLAFTSYSVKYCSDGIGVL